MKITRVVLLFCVVASLGYTEEAKSVKEEGVTYIKMLGGALKKELKAEMKKDRTGYKALVFCTEHADRITQEVNQKLPAYAKVRRTALKVRNHKMNAPDEVDIKVMGEYIADIEANKFSSTDIKVVEHDNVTRVYKPLPTSGVCLNCHGTLLSDEVVDSLKKFYPKDEAIGFDIGMLRGVIVAEIRSTH